tara:strand:+ start:28221 stop:28517 length:297 start_codon:yes stop_codon:yes gene_type:complete
MDTLNFELLVEIHPLFQGILRKISPLPDGRQASKGRKFKLNSSIISSSLFVSVVQKWNSNNLSNVNRENWRQAPIPFKGGNAKNGIPFFINQNERKQS